jgi:hypothetical protein
VQIKEIINMRNLSKSLLLGIISLGLFCAPPYRKQFDLAKIYLKSSKWEELDIQTYKFNEKPTNEKYGYTQEENIKVAYRNNTDTLWGPKMEDYYIAHLQCNCGGDIKYYRIGSCCPVPSKNALIGDMAMLDIFKIKCIKCNKSSEIYINMYDNDTALYAPAGYNLKLIK